MQELNEILPLPVDVTKSLTGAIHDQAQVVQRVDTTNYRITRQVMRQHYPATEQLSEGP